MHLRRTDFKSSGQRKFHISLCFVIVYVKLFLAAGFEIGTPWWFSVGICKYKLGYKSPDLL